MKSFILLAVLSASISAFAGGISPSTEGSDHGVVTGALYSKVKKVKAGKFDYVVIGANFEEPAVAPVQTIVVVSDPALLEQEGTDSLTYNLGTQISELVSVKAKGDKVVITGRIRDYVENGMTNTIKTYTVQYSSKSRELTLVTK